MSTQELLMALGLCVVLPIAALITAFAFRRLTSDERMKAIEKGVAIPVTAPDPYERAANSRRAGIILIAIGLGLIVLSAVIVVAERERDAWTLSGVAAIPILIGVGLLFEYTLRKKELDASNGRSARVPQ